MSESLLLKNMVGDKALDSLDTKFPQPCQIPNTGTRIEQLATGAWPHPLHPSSPAPANPLRAFLPICPSPADPPLPLISYSFCPATSPSTIHHRMISCGQLAMWDN